MQLISSSRRNSWSHGNLSKRAGEKGINARRARLEELAWAAETTQGAREGFAGVMSGVTVKSRGETITGATCRRNAKSVGVARGSEVA